jgi:hypothetical protein
MNEQMIEAAIKTMREEQRVNQNLELGFDDDVYDLAVLTIAAIEPFIEVALKDRIEALTAENERLASVATDFASSLIVAENNLSHVSKENERLREYLSSALETLRDAEVCDDGCSLCNEAFAALEKQP